MSRIQAVRVYEHFIELIPISAERYGPLFDIDSISLILGTNGSGKTRILLSLANAVGSSQDESFQIYYHGTPNGQIEPDSPYNDNICSIYFSALPYKRKILRRKGIINASPKSRTSDDSNRLEEFGMISNLLQIQTELSGVVNYSRIVFRTILIPIIKQSKKVTPPELKHLISYLERLDKDRPDETIDHIAMDKHRESILYEIEVFLEGFILDKLNHTDGLLFMSSLEYIHYNAGKKISNIVALGFLEKIGIIEAQSTNSSEFGFQELTRVVENTGKLIRKYCSFNNYPKGDRIFKFRIDDMNISEEIKGIDTSIKIEWSNQSSGLQALVEQFSLIDDAIGKASSQQYKSILLLIDEGDAYLHLDWQRKYISILNQYLGRLKRKYRLQNLQLIMATHSPLLAADIPGDFVTNLDLKKFTGTFAAPLEEVVANAFSSNSLGEFAAHNINEIYKRALLGKATEYDHNLVDSIGDVSIKTTLKRTLQNDN